MAKMLSRDLNAHKFACGCCFEHSDNGKGRKKDRRQSRRRETQKFREALAGRQEL